MKKCLRIIKNYLDDRNIENYIDFNDGYDLEFISCTFPQFNNLNVLIESPFENEEVLIRSIIVNKITTKDLSIAYSNINRYNAEYDFLKVAIQTQDDRKFLIASTMIPSLLSGLEVYFAKEFQKFLESVIALKKNMFYSPFYNREEKITNETIDNKLMEGFKESISSMNKDFLDVLYKNIDDGDNYNRVKRYLNILNEFATTDKSNEIQNLQYKVIFLTQLIDLSTDIKKKTAADFGMQDFIVNASDNIVKLFKELVEFIKDDIVNEGDDTYYSKSNSLELIFDPLYSSIKDNEFKFTEYFLENEIDEYWQEILETINETNDEWVYDDIFKYDKSQLKDFANDVNIKDCANKTKSELIESILNTLNKMELIELCKNNNISGFSGLSKTDIIKLIIKNKNNLK